MPDEIQDVLARLDANVGAAMDEIKTRLAAVESVAGELTEEQRTNIVQQVVGALSSAPDVNGMTRKLRFGGGDSRLKGSKFGRMGMDVGDIEFLYDLQNSLRNQPRAGGGVYHGPSAELEAAFKDVSDAYYLTTDEVRELGYRELDVQFPRVPKHGKLNRMFGRQERLDQQGYDAAVRAMDSAETAYGLQLIGAQYVPELWDAARPASRIFPLFDAFEMTAPTAYLPVEADLPDMLWVGENTANNSSDYTTDKTGSNRVTVTAQKFIIHQMWSGEMEEDSIIPFVPYLRRQSASSLAHFSDSLVINGDTTNLATGNINEDDADPADTRHWLAFDGIRHAALVDNTGNANDIAAAHDSSHYLALKTDMVQANTYAPMHWGYPLRSEDLVFAMDFSTYAAALQLDEVLTVDKYGPQATILTGELGRIWGHPIIPTQVIKLTVADGKVDTADTGTKGQIVAFNRNGFKVGHRRRVMLETERLPGRDQTRLIYSLRLGFGRYSATGAASGIEAAAVAYNITV